MPLHDWTDRAGWEGMHRLWITELLRWVKPLPLAVEIGIPVDLEQTYHRAAEDAYLS